VLDASERVAVGLGHALLCAINHDAVDHAVAQQNGCDHA
jgi:hypothetical protein